MFNRVPDVVNGRATDYRFIFATAGLAAPWHWVSDDLLAALPEPDAEDALRLRVVCEATFHAIALAVEGVPAGKARVMSVLLAASRSSVRRAYGVVNADIVDTQLSVGLTAVAANSTLTAAGAIPADIAGGLTIAAWTAERDAVGAAYDALANSFIPMAIHAAIGMPPCNGGTIITTGVHHYVDPHKNICDTVIRQVFGINVVPPGGMTMEEFSDVLCHKVCHPVESPVLAGLARNMVLKDRLNAINLGSASVRIPFLFSPERAASAYRALVRQVAQAGPSSNVVVETTPVAELVTAVTDAIAATPGSVGLRNATDLVNTFKADNGFHLAWCAGFMNALFEATDTPMRGRTTVNAASLVSIRNDNAAAFAEGADHHALAAKWRRARAKEGHLPGYGLFGATAPRAFANPETELELKAKAEAAARPVN
jgi:hypothetical protein